MFAIAEVYPAYMLGDESKKKEMLEKVANESTPRFFKQLAKILEQGGGEFFAGNEVLFVYFNNLGSGHGPFKSSSHMSHNFPSQFCIFSVENMAHKVFCKPAKVISSYEGNISCICCIAATCRYLR